MLEYKNINISIDEHIILRDVSFTVETGSIVGIAGESGSGKTVLAKHTLGLLDEPFKNVSGEIVFLGKVYNSNDSKIPLRGRYISMIFQNPTASLNPVMTIGEQMIETIRIHNKGINYYEKAVELLNIVKIDNPEQRLKSYPHNLSGGMNQRVMIAMSLSSNPKLLIADEPTTALDVTIQKGIIELLIELNQKNNLTIVFISHDLKLLQSISDKIIILYAGEVMEEINSMDLINDRIKNPYTKMLKRCVPSIKDDFVENLETIDGVIPKNSKEYENRCIFSDRCPYAKEQCFSSKPDFKNGVRCHYPLWES
ncbi:MAG: ABC transporter ATP-binding protein [Calditerrivibrio sp.]|nr:ABC transporter ATP-binding protein [Calditerrivibrio sp.]MCA1981034.1 ABC transporter ATP-binding protein [Calditerrivibrio sp.]